MAGSRIPSLVLMNLGLLVGCKPAETGSEPVVLPSATAAASSTAAPSASAPATVPVAGSAPVASTAPPPVASSPPPVASSAPAPVASAPKGDPKKLGAVCKSDSDCGGYYCVLGFNGATFTKTGHCGANQPIYEGRPLVAEGRVHVASTVGSGSDCPDLVRWREAALEEHASIAAFARTVCELVALGAPAWLLEATSRAMSDEIRHAEDSFAWLARLGGGELRAGPLPAAVAPLRTGPDAPAELFRDVFRGGAIGETLAAARADVRAEAAPTPELAAFHRGIAEDEARHAALAFLTLDWLVATHPALAAVRTDEIEAWRRTADADARALIEPLLAAPRVTAPS